MLRLRAYVIVRLFSVACLFVNFSDVSRMKKSICNLIAAPQNNLRVFHNGRCVYADGHAERDLKSALGPYVGNES